MKPVLLRLDTAVQLFSRREPPQTYENVNVWRYWGNSLYTVQK